MYTAPRHLRYALAGLSLVVASLAPLSAAAAISNTRLAVVAAAPVLPVGATPEGAATSSHSVAFQVYLKPANPAALQSYLVDIANPHSPLYRHYLSRGEFAARFGADQQVAAALRTQLQASGLHVSTLQNGDQLQVTGTVSAANTAFSTTIERAHLATGRVATYTASALRLPAAFAPSVLGVSGLNTLATLSQPHHTIAPHSQVMWPVTGHAGRHFTQYPSATAGAPTSCAGARNTTIANTGGVTDDQVANAYGATGLYKAGDFGQGQTIALFELEPFLTSDINSFASCYLNAKPNISVVNVDGGPGVGPGAGEAALDIEDAVALAPRAHVVVYQAPNTGNASLDAYQQIVADDSARIISTSWGLCENAVLSYNPTQLQIENQIFAQAAAQGQTVFAAAGDAGSDDCSRVNQGAPTTPYLTVDDPASQPYVTAVGGTTLYNTANPASELVWNDSTSGGATGGGVSAVWPQTPWQASNARAKTAAADTSCNPNPTQCRVLPDVSAVADPYTGITILYNGNWTTIGGTSSATPIWAAMLALTNSSATCQQNPATKAGVGFATPLLYQVANNKALYSQSFNDVTSGNNDLFNMASGSFSAAKGFDAASGLGTPRLTGANGSPGLAAALCSTAAASTTSSLTSVTPTVGSVAGGTSVVIQGSGFMTSGHGDVAGVDFGSLPATSFQVLSNTQLVAISPAASTPKSIGSLVPTQSSLVSVIYNSGHIATGPAFGYDIPAQLGPAPQVLTLGQQAGSDNGGTTVNIYGQGFTGATAVTFGGLPATNFQVLSDGVISAVAPAMNPSMCPNNNATDTPGLCQANVAVTGPGGTSAPATINAPLYGAITVDANNNPVIPSGLEIYPAASEFDYQAPITMTSIVDAGAGKGNPSHLWGGSDGIILANNLNYLTLTDLVFSQVGKDPIHDAAISQVNKDSLTFSMPGDPYPAPSGNTMQVSIEASGVVSSSQSVSFGDVPQILSLSTNTASVVGGATLTITGQDFSSKDGVYLSPVGGGSPVGIYSTITSPNSHTLQVTLPSLVPNGYVVIVQNNFGSSTSYFPTKPSLAAYAQLAHLSIVASYPGAPVVLSASNNSCSTAGGCVTTITGKNFGALANLHLSVGATPVKVNSLSEKNGIYMLTFTAPPTANGLPGVQNITVSTPNGISPTSFFAIELYQ